MQKAFLDIHVIQSVPPSNLNRDDTGAPKSAVYGGVRRARVSSQAWKRATRSAFSSLVDSAQLGVRTKRVVELIADEVIAIDPSLADVAENLGTQVLAAVGIKVEKPKASGDEQTAPPAESGYLVFFSHLQLAKAARQAVEDHSSGTKFTKKVYKEILQSDNSLDIALFGRMIADLTDLGVDASVQVAHALSVHAVESEADFYTAVDDHKQTDADRDAGAGMMGTIEFNSSTLYRYATVSIAQLVRNLGSVEAAQAALAAFAEAFTLSMPTGKINSFANTTVPSAVVFTLRTDRPISFVEAFEDPVVQDGGYVPPAIARLVEYAQDTHDTFGAPEGQWAAGVGQRAQALSALADLSPLKDASQAAVEAAINSFTALGSEESA